MGSNEFHTGPISLCFMAEAHRQRGYVPHTNKSYDAAAIWRLVENFQHPTTQYVNLIN